METKMIGSVPCFFFNGSLKTGYINMHDAYSGAGNFPKLKELAMQIDAESAEKQIDTVRKAKNLQKIHLSHLVSRSIPHDKSKALMEAVYECKHLEYVSVSGDWGNAVRQLCVIEGGLIKTKKMKRNQMKIKASHFNMYKDDLGGAMLVIPRIMGLLKDSTSDYMFIWNLNDGRSKLAAELDEQQIVSNLASISPDIVVKSYDFCFVLMNKNCKINGWNESWMIGTEYSGY